MSGFAEGWEEKILEEAVGRKPETERWIVLCTTAPTKSAAGTAAAYTGAKRVKTTHTAWKAAEGGEPSKITNESVVTFPECTGSESKVHWFEIWTAETGGERVAWGELKEEKTITPGDTPSFAAGKLEVTQK